MECHLALVHRAWYVDVAEIWGDLHPHLLAASYNYGNDPQAVHGRRVPCHRGPRPAFPESRTTCRAI